ncbi:MAG TPA: tetratricopeptide repeat protein, partial [Spirochaetota bacterium]|nr:tetratricopeptide repeat protein [Spirochaetota bacterium]
MGLILTFVSLGIIILVLSVNIIKQNAYKNKLQKAKTLIEEDKIQQAFPIVDELYQKEPNDIRVLWMKACIENKQGQYIMAIGTLNDIIKLNNFNQEITEIKVHQTLAQCYADSGRHQEALTEYFVVADLDETNYEANSFIANTFYNLKKYEQAEPYLKKIIVDDENNVKALTMLGWIKLQQGELNAAENYCKKVLQSAPHNEEALFLMGLTAKEKTETNNAIEYFELAAKAQGEKKTESEVNAGICYFKNQAWKDAIAKLDHNTTRLNHKTDLWQEGMFSLIFAYIKTHQFKKLKPKIGSYLEQYPQDKKISHINKLCRFVFDNPELMRYASLSANEFVIHTQNLFSKNGFIIDDYKKFDESIVFFKISKIVKSGHKQSELVFLNREPVYLTENKINSIQEKLKKENVHSGYILTPFDFSSETVAT